MSKRDRTPTRPTIPIPRSDLDRRANPRWGDDVRILHHLAGRAAPLALDELARAFPDRAQAIVEVVDKLRRDGLVELIDHAAGKSVALTPDGLRVVEHL